MQHISPTELQTRLASGEPLQLVDVREPGEHQAFNLGGLLIPLPELFEHAASIPRDIPVVLYCKMGIRSQIAIQRLEERLGFKNLLNLQGGLDRWTRETSRP